MVVNAISTKQRTTGCIFHQHPAERQRPQAGLPVANSMETRHTIFSLTWMISLTLYPFYFFIAGVWGRWMSFGESPFIMPRFYEKIFVEFNSKSSKWYYLILLIFTNINQPKSYRLTTRSSFLIAVNTSRWAYCPCHKYSIPHPTARGMTSEHSVPSNTKYPTDLLCCLVSLV